MARTRVKSSDIQNRAAPDSGISSRPILSNESGVLVQRMKEMIGDESVSSFSRKCGVSEAVLRSYLNDGRTPSIDKATAIAEAGGVTLDWLATGRPPRTRAELAALLKKGAPAPEGAPEGSDLWRLAVEVVQEWQVREGLLLPPDKFLRALELLVELADGEPTQVRALSAKVLRLAA